MKTELYTLPFETSQPHFKQQVIALGLFDGLHVGHRAVINTAVAFATRRGLCSAIFTFQPGTVNTKPGQGTICSPEDWVEQLSAMGVNRSFSTDFATLKHLSPVEFIDQILVNTLHAAAVVCGFNYRFGHGGVGDLSLLQQLCAERGIEVLPVDAVNEGDLPISSTRIRQAFASGDMRLAGRLLGRPVRLTGAVQHGQGLGHKLGFPTVNFPVESNLVQPRFGVYASAVEVDDRLFNGVTNIGLRPTVGGNVALVETWIEGLQEDLYGRTLTVYPILFLRPEKAFPDLEALQQQIRLDIQAAHHVFHANGEAIQAVLFDYDDTLNYRAPSFAKGMRAVMQHFYPQLDEETLTARTNEMISLNGRGYGYAMAMSYEQLAETMVTKWSDAVDPDPQEALKRLWIEFPLACACSRDAHSTIAELRRRGFKIGVITNGTTTGQHRKLDASGLQPLIDTAVISGDEKVEKPNPAIFLRAAARLGVDPCRCVFVGDHPVNDITGSRAAGMQPVFIALEEDPTAEIANCPADVTAITALSQLLELPFLQQADKDNG